jgi:peroxiredoxin
MPDPAKKFPKTLFVMLGCGLLIAVAAILWFNSAPDSAEASLKGGEMSAVDESAAIASSPDEEAAMAEWEKLRDELTEYMNKTQTVEVVRLVIQDVGEFAEANEDRQAGAVAWLNHGMLLSKLGDKKEAEDSLRRAIKISRDPSHTGLMRHELAKLTVKIGTEAPNFLAVTLDGKAVALNDLRGKVVVLDFWATWCMPCIREIPGLRNLHARYKSDGLEIIGISLDEDEKLLRDFVLMQNLPWPQIYSLGGPPDSQPHLLYGVEPIPDMVVIGADGKIVARQVVGEALEDAVKYALNASNGSRPFSATMDKAAPALAVQEWIRGEPMTLDGLKGKVVLLDLFQIICPGCVRARPDINRLYKTYRDKGLEAVGVAVAFEHHTAQTSTMIRDYVKQEDFSYPVAMDRDLIKTFRRYRAKGTPFAVLIDRTGAVRYLDFFDVDRIEPLVRQLLDEPPSKI